MRVILRMRYEEICEEITCVQPIGCYLCRWQVGIIRKVSEVRDCNGNLLLEMDRMKEKAVECH